jgi:predicted pyridoxine 5'-phosphate oxidase superfamily flavin-nucleotide-binding protein
MSHNFGSLVFTPAVHALQEKYGSRRQYARMAAGGPSPVSLGEGEREFIAERDSFYMASTGSTGWPYVQHRGGPVGFLKVVDNQTIAFADFRGNKQFVSTGNLMTDDRVALILVDYPQQARLKILGRVKVLEGEAAKPWLAQLSDPGYKAVVERVYLIKVEAFDWNCPQHVTPRFTVAQLREVLEPLESQLTALHAENKKLRADLARYAAL